MLHLRICGFWSGVGTEATPATAAAAMAACVGAGMTGTAVDAAATLQVSLVTAPARAAGGTDPPTKAKAMTATAGTAAVVALY